MATRRNPIWWGDFPAAAFRDLDPEATVAVLPLAAIEQHGPHLPLCTDTAIMQGMLDTLFLLLPADLDVRVLPIQAIGKSNEHIAAPGTLTLSAAAQIAALTDIGTSVARAGIRKLVFLTSHGGNEEVMGIVAREMRVVFGMLAVKTSWERFGRPEGLYPDKEVKQGIHGGDVETSLMLHFRPELVDMAKAENFTSSYERAEKTFELLRPTSPHAFAWLAADLNPHGVVGNASAATPEKGRLTAAHQAKGFLTLLRDIRKARLDEWVSNSE